MSNDLNRVHFIGRLGRDAEYIPTATGTAMCKFSIAVSESYRDAAGQKEKTTQWVNCVVFGKLVEVCMKFLRKGSRAYVGGKFNSNKYVGKDGVEKTGVQINVQELQVLDFAEPLSPLEEVKHEPSEFDNESIPF